ncbi:MAG: hypothetical protein QNL99_15795 [SAR86 cluster bacterium]|jgi:hypothetical protein
MINGENSGLLSAIAFGEEVFQFAASLACRGEATLTTTGIREVQGLYQFSSAANSI